MEEAYLDSRQEGGRRKHCVMDATVRSDDSCSLVGARGEGKGRFHFRHYHRTHTIDLARSIHEYGANPYQQTSRISYVLLRANTSRQTDSRSNCCLIT